MYHTQGRKGGVHAFTLVRFRSKSLAMSNAATLGFVEALKWKDPKGYDFKTTEHINVQELKALEDEMSRRSQRGKRDSRIACCCDSRVVVGAVAEGLSGSRVLSKHLM